MFAPVNSALFRTLLVYGIVLPLAVVLGWMLSTPFNMQTVAVVGFVTFVLLLPLILNHHYAFLVFTWNATLQAFFLPSSPHMWAVAVAINLCMAIAYRILQRRPLFMHVPLLTFPLLALALVVLFTAKFKGGFGLRSLGSDTYGSRQYFYLLMAIGGYFAFAAQIIPWDKVHRFTKLFFLSGLTAGVSNVLYYIKPLWFLYYLFPAGLAVSQAQSEFLGTPMARISGFSAVGTVIVQYLLARHGLRGVFSFRIPWRAALVLGCLAMTLLSGYRSGLLSVLLLVATLFVLEGLLRTRWTFVLLAVGLLGLVSVLPVVKKLPLSMQRTLSVLPIEVDPVAAQDARGSVEWRVLMWKAMLPELPKYLWVGKGYSLDPTEMYLTTLAVRKGYAETFEASRVVGDYHSGPLSVYVPFGLAGLLAFIAVLVAGVRALWLNLQHGNERLKTLNRFLLAMFVAKALLFIFIFGSLHSDMFTFAGILGLSVALNRGVCRQPVRERSTKRFNAPFAAAAGTA